MKDFDIRVDQGDSYERKRWLYLLSLPLMWILTIWVLFKKGIGLRLETNTFWFDGINKYCREIKERATSWRALDIIYNHLFGKDKSFSGRVGDYWIGMMNAQAVRNRLKLVKRELIEAIVLTAQKEKEVRLLSLASGSAQSVIEALEAISEFSNINVKVTLLDLDPEAIESSKKLAEDHKVKDKITFVVGSTSKLEEINNGARPHIVEMVGFLDYRPDRKAALLINRIYQAMAPGGMFFTANIMSNPERWFLQTVINWRMIYRKPEKLASIVAAGGFGQKDFRILCEPHKIHAVAICRKPIL